VSRWQPVDRLERVTFVRPDTLTAVTVGRVFFEELYSVAYLAVTEVLPCSTDEYWSRHIT